MSPERAFWSRVQAALDARTDPLEDPWVEDALVEHPEWLAPLLRLRERLEVLPAPASPKASPLPWAAAAGLLLTLGLALARPERVTEPAPEPAAAEPVGRILDWSITVRRTRQDSRTVLRNHNGHLSTEEASVERAAPLPDATAVASLRLVRSVPPSPSSR